ncbi:MAG: hypothetical protein HQK54_02435 [Oligoflexales bacterium]|nr:hypothetical protein [Oligoflexales bacterium]
MPGTLKTPMPKHPEKNGIFILAANTIGRYDDIPQRSLKALRESDLLIFEEDRPARLALKTAGIHREYLKYSEHRNANTIYLFKKFLKEDKVVCYMSDQGMPTIADPGRELLEIAYELGSRVEVIPGASSITAALSACPFLYGSFKYHGFVERKREDRITTLKKIAEENDPVILVDTPYRLKNLIDDCIISHGPKRMALLAMDISGPRENFLFNNMESLQKTVSRLEEKINFVLILSGKGNQRQETS